MEEDGIVTNIPEYFTSPQIQDGCQNGDCQYRNCFIVIDIAYRTMIFVSMPRFWGSRKRKE
jgi:hypothetical protein